MREKIKGIMDSANKKDRISKADEDKISKRDMEMAESIVDNLAEIGVRECGIRISRRNIMILITSSYNGIGYSASIRTGEETFTSTVIDIEEELIITNEFQQKEFLKLLESRNEYYLRKNSGKNVSQGIGVNKNYKFEFAKNEVIEFDADKITKAFTDSIDEFIGEEIGNFRKYFR